MIDLNQADLEQLARELATIPTSVLTKGARKNILDRRRTRGPFRSEQELLEIPGIGPGKLQELTTRYCKISSSETAIIYGIGCIHGHGTVPALDAVFNADWTSVLEQRLATLKGTPTVLWVELGAPAHIAVMREDVTASLRATARVSHARAEAIFEALLGATLSAEDERRLRALYDLHVAHEERARRADLRGLLQDSFNDNRIVEWLLGIAARSDLSFSFERSPFGAWLDIIRERAYSSLQWEAFNRGDGEAALAYLERYEYASVRQMIARDAALANLTRSRSLQRAREVPIIQRGFMHRRTMLPILQGLGYEVRWDETESTALAAKAPDALHFGAVLDDAPADELRWVGMRCLLFDLIRELAIRRAPPEAVLELWSQLTEEILLLSREQVEDWFTTVGCTVDEGGKASRSALWLRDQRQKRLS